MKNIKKFIVFSLILLCVMFFAPKIQILQANASDTLPATVTETTYNYTFNLDLATFNALCALEHEVCGEFDLSGERAFYRDFFSTGYKTAQPISQEGIRIKQDLENGVLNLCTGENAIYECLRNISQITQIEGLKNLEFSGITQLILDDNSISNINQDDLSSFTDLTSLSINNNDLREIEFSNDTKSSLSYLSLRNNLISEIDLRNLVNGASVDLANNLLEDFNNLYFSGTLNHLDLSFNNLTEITNITGIASVVGCTPVLLVQGLNKELEMGDKIILINDGYVSNLRGVLTYSSQSEFTGQIFATNGEQLVESLIMPAGKISLNFSYTNADSSLLGEDLTLLQQEREFNFALPSPKCVATSNGNEITQFEQSESMNFEFSIDINSNIPNYEDIISNASLYVGLSEEEELVNSILIDENGSYNIVSYVIFDGIRSENFSAWVNKTNGVPDVLIIVIISGILVIAICAIYLVRWFRNGGVIAPLSDREIYELNRSKKARDSGTRYEYSYERDQNDKEADDIVDLNQESQEQDYGKENFKDENDNE